MDKTQRSVAARNILVETFELMASGLQTATAGVVLLEEG